MAVDHWLAFVAATAVMLAIPGPTVLLVTSYALGYGGCPALAVVVGVALGGMTAMTASMLGLGALLAASSGAFTALRWFGGAYLVYLGVKLWRTPPSPLGAPGNGASQRAPLRLFLHGYAVTASNPKAVVFFVAFVPQFLVKGEPFGAQAGVLIATFLTMDVLNSLLFAFVASAARRRLREPKIQRAINRTGGSLLVGAGLLAAGWRRTA